MSAILCLLCFISAPPQPKTPTFFYSFQVEWRMHNDFGWAYIRQGKSSEALEQIIGQLAVVQKMNADIQSDIDNLWPQEEPSK